MVKLNSPLITTCTSKGCQNLRYYMARVIYKKNLCRQHFIEFAKKKAQRKKERDKNRKCNTCKKLITNKRNKKYCSATCRRIAMRVVAHPIVCEVTKTAVWQRIEKLLRRSPLGLASINDLGDIYHLYALLSMKKIHAELITKGQPLLLLKLVHKCPLKSGGLNTLKNILVVPKTRVIHPCYSNEKEINPIYKGEYQSKDTEAITITDSLYSSLVFYKGKSKKIRQENETGLIELCLKIKQTILEPITQIPSIDINYSPNNWLYANHFFVPYPLSKPTQNKRVIYSHLMSQFGRIPLSQSFHSDLDETFNAFDKFLAETLDGFSLSNENLTFQFFELLALSIYHDLVNSDQSFTQKIIIAIYKALERMEVDESDAQQQKEQTFQTVVTYINHNFNQSLSTKLSDYNKFILFYSQFFSQPKSSVEGNHD